jgi:hypothetical protein
VNPPVRGGRATNRAIIEEELCIFLAGGSFVKQRRSGINEMNITPVFKTTERIFTIWGCLWFCKLFLKVPRPSRRLGKWQASR